MKHINLTNWRGSITDWTKLNYIYGGLDDSYAVKGNLRIDKDNYNYVEYRESNNMIQLVDVGETTDNGITYKVENGAITVVRGTAESNFAIYLSLKKNINLIANKNYKIALFNPTYVATTDYVGLYISGSTVVGITHTTSANMTKDVSVAENMVAVRFCVRFTGGSTYSNFVIKPMLVKGTTAPTIYEPGFEGKKYVITEKLGIVDLGSLTWSAHGTGEHDRTSSSAITNAKPNNLSSRIPNISCPKYTTGSPDDVYSHSSDNLITLVNQLVYIYSSALVGMTGTQVKEALSGIMLTYELNNPVIEVIE